MSWVFELGQGPLRAYVGSIYGNGGAPYRMTVARPGGACSTFLGLRSLTAAVEAFCTTADVFGTPVPAGARAAWNASAARIDGGGGAAN